MNDSTGQSSWTYDNADNVTQLVTPQGTMQYAYDAWNRRSSLTEGSAVTNYGYTSGKLTSITKSADSVATNLSYDSYGRLITKNDGATKTTYGYDSNDRLNSIVHANASTNAVLHQETYNYDLVNNLTSKVVNSVATSYTYDDIDQLLTESGGGLSNVYTYDHNGNRKTKAWGGVNLDTYTYDDADKLTDRVGNSGTFHYTYDNCGRMTSANTPSLTKTYTWDYEDRMTSVGGSAVIPSTYSYNGVGSRVAKSNSLGSRTYKRDGVGVTAPVLSDGVASMVPGISEKTSSGTSFIHSDHLGTMKAMSSSATVTDTATYDAFGKVLSRTGSSLTQKGFAGGFGYQEDGESGLKLLGHRYYDPETGRFISRDPAFAGTNWFAYCRNNPLKAVDPTGYEEDTPFLESLGMLRLVMAMPEPMRSNCLRWIFGMTLTTAAATLQKATEFIEGGGEALSDEIETMIASASDIPRFTTINPNYLDINKYFQWTGKTFEWRAEPNSVGVMVTNGRINCVAVYDPMGRMIDRLDLFSRSGSSAMWGFPHYHWANWLDPKNPCWFPVHAPGIPPNWQ